jgi:hypothetical protein
VLDAVGDAAPYAAGPPKYYLRHLVTFAYNCAGVLNAWCMSTRLVIQGSEFGVSVPAPKLDGCPSWTHSAASRDRPSSSSGSPLTACFSEKALHEGSGERMRVGRLHRDRQRYWRDMEFARPVLRLSTCGLGTMSVHRFDRATSHRRSFIVLEMSATTELA